MNEHDEQVLVIEWRDLQVNVTPELWLLHANPNGGKRHPGVARKIKREGGLAGVCDLFLPVARKGYHGLYIEMKKVKGGRVSQSQKDFIRGVQEQGYCAHVCLGHADAIETIESYMEII